MWMKIFLMQRLLERSCKFFTNQHHFILQEKWLILNSAISLLNKVKQQGHYVDKENINKPEK